MSQTQFWPWHLEQSIVLTVWLDRGYARNLISWKCRLSFAACYCVSACVLGVFIWLVLLTFVFRLNRRAISHNPVPQFDHFWLYCHLLRWIYSRGPCKEHVSPLSNERLRDKGRQACGSLTINLGGLWSLVLECIELSNASEEGMARRRQTLNYVHDLESSPHGNTLWQIVCFDDLDSMIGSW